MRSGGGHLPAKVLEYDRLRRRLWILGQRCHHGATGTLVTATALLGLILPAGHSPDQQDKARSMLVLALTGGALMAHDWKDRSIWFQRGRGSQS